MPCFYLQTTIILLKSSDKKSSENINRIGTFFKKDKNFDKIICFFLKNRVHLCYKSSENYENGTFLKTEKGENMKNEIVILQDDTTEIAEAEILGTEIVETKDFFDKKQTKKKIKYLSEEEFLQLKRVLDTTGNIELKAIIMLQYALALRVNEVLKLKFSDVVMRADVKTAKNYYVVNASNSKQKSEINETKELRINNEVAMLIMTISNKYELKKDDFICRTGKGKVMAERNYNKYLKKIFKNAGLKEDKAHSHVFRHSRAIHLLNAGLNLAQVKKVLGHVSILNTMIYTQYSNHDINKALATVDGD